MSVAPCYVVVALTSSYFISIFPYLLAVTCLRFLLSACKIIKSTMTSHRAEAYMKVFAHFLAQPKTKSTRKGSFEYMEMAWPGQQIKEKEEPLSPIEKFTYDETFENDNNEEYLSCIDASQSNNNQPSYTDSVKSHDSASAEKCATSSGGR